MKVLVTDGNNRAALAITRSLGRNGHRIVVGETSATSLASVSRYCSESWVYPDPFALPDAFVEDLLRNVRNREIDVLLPVAEVTTALVTGNARNLGGRCRLPFPDPETFRRASDKRDVIRIAGKLGIPVPRTHVIEEKEGARFAASGLSFPVVVKPHRSRIPTDNGWLTTSVTYARTPEDLSALLRGKEAWEFPILLQERIRGPGIGVFACYQNGRMVCVFGHRRIREKPPSGGVSVLRESVLVSPEARDYAERLLDELKWHGIAMVEFKLDERDGRPKLMEINGRFWGSLQLAIDSGVDFPDMLLKVAEGTPVGPAFAYRTGVRTRWFWGDMDSLLIVLLKRRSGLQLPDGHPGRIGSLLEFMKFFGKDLHYEVESLDDIRPWLHETSMRFRRNR